VRWDRVIPTQDASTVRLMRRLHDELSKEGREAGKEVSVRVAPGLLETLLNQKRGRHQPAREAVRRESGVPRGPGPVGVLVPRSKTGRRSSVRVHDPDR